MFRAAELGQKVSKKEFKARSRDIRQQLLESQILLNRTRKFSIVIDFAGVDGAGKGSTVNQLHAWMDTRLIRTNAYSSISESERLYPKFWRFWRDLPTAGSMALNLSGRYSQPLLDRVNDRISDLEYMAALKRIQNFERELADDGTLILKFWMHLSRDGQKQRLEALEANPETAWRVRDKDWEHWKLYDRFIQVAERTIMETNTEHAPWHIIEGADNAHRILAVSEILLEAMQKRFKKFDYTPRHELLIDQTAIEAADSLPPEPKGHVTIFKTLDMTPRLPKAPYKKALAREQARIHLLQREAFAQGRSSVIVFEGPDAAGKGGVIRRLIPTLDARNYRVLQFGKPTDEEDARHYLWRFWRKLQRSGHLTIFDRSWYGRVLVERVEGFAREDEWRRAYAEINDFESQLVEDGTVLVKFWLQITPDEQRRRFEERRTVPYKSWKLTQEDWRNRAKWYEYERAAHDMVQYTSTHTSPWMLIAANDKNHARVEVLTQFADHLEKCLSE